MTPRVENVKQSKGIAGQYEISAEVTYPDETPERIAFVGSVYGGPIVMVTPAGQTFVSQSVTDRIGSTLDESWIARFFAGSE